MSRNRILPFIAGLALLLACGDPSADPADGTQVAPGVGVTEQGLYEVELRPATGDVRLGEVHGWQIRLRTADGERFAPTRLAFGGGMPEHGHGFETAPRVTQALASGTYLVEGVRFHMGGNWRLRVEVVGPDGPDVALFHVEVPG